MTLGSFRIFSKIRGDIRKSRCTTGVVATSSPCVVDNGDKFATSVNNTGGKFAAGVNDADGKLPPVSNNTGGKFATCVIDTGGK